MFFCSLSWLYSPHYLADLPPRVSHSSSSFHWYCYEAMKVMLCRICRRAMKMKWWKLKPAHISCPGSCIENWISRPSVTVDFLDIVEYPPLFSETYDFLCQKCVLKFLLNSLKEMKSEAKWAPNVFRKKEGKSKGSLLSGHPKKSLEDPIVVAQGDTKVPSQGAPASTWVLS